MQASQPGAEVLAMVAWVLTFLAMAAASTSGTVILFSYVIPIVFALFVAQRAERELW